MKGGRGGWSILYPCGFHKNIFSQFSQNVFFLNSSVRSELVEIFSRRIAISINFHQFSQFFDISMLQKN